MRAGMNWDDLACSVLQHADIRPLRSLELADFGARLADSTFVDSLLAFARAQGPLHAWTQREEGEALLLTFVDSTDCERCSELLQQLPTPVRVAFVHATEPGHGISGALLRNESAKACLADTLRIGPLNAVSHPLDLSLSLQET